MKRLVKFSAILAVAALSLVACKKQEFQAPQSKKTIDVTFSAGMPSTRTMIAAGGNDESGYDIEWSSSDVSANQIALFEIIDGEFSQAVKNTNGSLYSGVANFNALLVDMSGMGDSFKYASFYPASAITDDLESLKNSTISFSLPATQNYVENSFDKSADLLISKLYNNGSNPLTEDAVVSFQFARLNAIVKMNLTNLTLGEGELVESISFKATDKVLAAPAILDVSTGFDDLIIGDSKTNDKITINLATPSASVSNVWFSCFPTTLETGDSYEIVITTNLNTYTKTGTIGANPLKFKSGDITTFSVNFATAVVTPKPVTITTDVLTFDDIPVETASSYVSFSDIKKNSNALYAGNAAKSKLSDGNIQIRSDKSTSGIVSTTSGGYLKSITIESNQGSKVIDIYGSNTPYTAASDLFDEKTWGKKIASINCNTTETIILNEPYQYIGIRSNSGASYITELTIVWADRFVPEPSIAAEASTKVVASGLNDATFPYSANNFTDDVTVSSVSGIVTSASANSGIVTYSVAPNYTGTERNGTIELVSASNNTITKTVTITQAADKFEVSTENITLSASSEEAHSFTIKSSYPFTISYNNSKVNVSPSSSEANDEAGVEISVNAVNENDGEPISTLDTITITRTTDASDENSTKTIIVNQAAKPAVGEAVYTLVTDVNSLSAGDKVIIAAANYNYALGNTQNTSNRASVSVTKSENLLSSYTDAAILTLGGDRISGFTFYDNDADNSGYLYAASSSSNHLKTQATNNANGQWTIVINNDTGVATVTAKGSNTRNILRFNNANNPKIFSCYSSGQTDICIYKLQ